MMTLIQAALTVPAHLLPGGIIPQAAQFGFKRIEKKRIEQSAPVDLVQFTFSSPSPSLKTMIFDQALERFLWHFAKGTPYQINKSFSDPSANECLSYHYRDNQLTEQAMPLADILNAKNPH
ncbi:hypothetical protein [Photobacterium nomapromontoriensis]|uniref:hypothetical protein n=1 Tax=Photobacterium nomapromontoriensis TaxID=2910237 RepID=UPI003D0D31B7